MKMMIVLNENKLNELGYNASDCYNKLDKVFSANGIESIGLGIYEGNDSYFQVFSVLFSLLTEVNWILLSAEKWFWWVTDEEQPDDCLKDLYELGKLPVGAVYAPN
ncbi:MULTISPECIES: hypothetical protein [unclassified Breznakia]|uniref:hypothetical protein n=1 Tax=unclassified Breznakia TaxID=2623764 RepID=UPI00247300E9|nr:MULTISPECIES: hypothetical protein [unclassified Breznakia]MDH6367381.1 hypothetical protein [Breznakia sp. PH1-1]MDH6403913.1 hypothetical protein [Breznakia sp. PF1-11]MDH6411622.1 hypothetical protein [Breznakia sp. PFB1-11]MDH6414548.1 hypothetical protein [Breznakia sp. PFB1-14]MDH6418654.1 hypothetical protein [Breznakia sp. PFB1-12]